MRFLFSIIFGISLCDELKDPCSNEGKINGPRKKLGTDGSSVTDTGPWINKALRIQPD